jgi:sn-1 stearoyl-lipid 9-desaturase
MAFIDKVLQEPSYGWTDSQGKLVIPPMKTLFRESFRRINIFKTRKNWIALYNWLVTACMCPFFIVFITEYIETAYLAFCVFYGTVFMAVHSTVWHHRYCTHSSFSFTNAFWKVLTQNLAIRTFPEEIFVIAHHVHHARSDMPGDPYNSRAGFMYCMLADVNHQSISKNLSEKDYSRTASLLSHAGCATNSFAQYVKWGSVSHPLQVLKIWLLNWLFWYSAFYLIGGRGLACAAFTGAMFWFIFVRAFNYTGHGGGKARHVQGVDFDRRNLSINQMRPGYMCGEWHNNHHLYPKSARAGFLPYQLDLAWLYILLLYKAGAVSSYYDSKPQFLEKYVKNKSAQMRRET